MFRLTIEQGDPKGAVFDFADGDVVIGRSHSARVRLAAADVSGQHIRITVKDGKAIAENLGRFPATLDGAPIQAPTALANGQHIALGKSTVLLFETVAEAGGIAEAKTGASFGDDIDATGAEHGAPEHEADITGKGGDAPAHPAAPAVSPPGASPSASPSAMRTTGAPPASPDALSQAGSWSGGAAGGEDGMTRAMQTRAAGQDELEFLRGAERHRARNRVLLIACVVLGAGIIAAVVATHRPAVETTISWPVDADGDNLEGRADSPLGGFSLVYPKTDDAKVSPIPNGLTVTCTLGQRHDLPLRITLEETVDDQYAQEAIETSIARWKAQVTADNSKWNIDTPLPVNLFVGEENGILFKILPYQRQDNGSWSGLASILRNGRRFIVIRAEVPTADRARAEDILYNRFIDPSTEFVRSHWEGSPDIPTASTAEILGRAHEELRRLAPATWDSVEAQLVGGLRKAVVEKNADDEKDALDMLVALRSKKALWYNEQLVQKEAAVAQGDTDHVRQIAEYCKAVFSDLQDQRFYEVRKW